MARGLPSTVSFSSLVFKSAMGRPSASTARKSTATSSVPPRKVGACGGCGAGVGLVTGAAEADANARAYYDSQYYGAPPPPGGSELVYSIQTSLARLGYDPGPADGLYGERTADAISQYQHANRLPVDGRPSPQLLNIMISQGG